MLSSLPPLPLRFSAASLVSLAGFSVACEGVWVGDTRDSGALSSFNVLSPRQGQQHLEHLRRAAGMDESKFRFGLRG